MEMKKSVLGLLICFGLLSGCGTNTPKEKSESSSSIAESSSVEEIAFGDTVGWGYGINQNNELQGDENSEFKLSGTIKEGNKVYLLDRSTKNVIAQCDVNDKNHFEMSGKIDGHEDVPLIFTNDNSSPSSATNSVELTYVPNQKIKDKANEEARKKAEAEEKKRQEEEKKAKEAEAKKQAEEEKKRQEEEEKRKAEEEKQRQEEEKKRQEEEAAAKAKADKEKKISEASRESRNALQKAYDYLDYTAFSKSGLYEQLLYEDYPEDAAQFAIDNVETDWNQNALQKAIDYLDYTAFSDQGLYEQLVYEGFTPEQAQYAINNLPD